MEIVQRPYDRTDIFAGPTRPQCAESRAVEPDKLHPGVGSCGSGPNCLINIGLTYFRRSLIKDKGAVLGGASSSSSSLAVQLLHSAFDSELLESAALFGDSTLEP
jgi:hypothetical protein